MSDSAQEVYVLKRDNVRINEVSKILKPVKFVPNQYGDRYIPRRYAQTSSSRFKAEYRHNPLTDILRMTARKDYWKPHLFALRFNEMFNLHPQTDNILSFQDVTNRKLSTKLKITRPFKYYMEPTNKNLLELDWSCRPRSKPLSFVESVHDLPRIKTEYSNIIDWSAKGQIAAIFSTKLVVWTPHTEETIAYSAQNTTGIAFNPTGDKLAMATEAEKGPALRLISKFHPSNRAHVLKVKVFDHLKCPIYCLAWDTTGQFIACGLSNGVIFIVRASDLEHINRDADYPRHSGSILEIKFSRSSKYMASSDSDRQLFIWNWNNHNMTPLLHWRNKVYEPLFEWHPWREEEIIIADTRPAWISLLHVSTRKVLASFRRANDDCLLSALTFNKLSGELLLSFSYDDDRLPDILVLASMNRVVDVLENHDEMISSLFWSPDGKLLASTGQEESLTIWNFFGSPPDGKKVNQGPPSIRHLKRNRIKESIDEFDYTFLYKPIR